MKGREHPTEASGQQIRHHESTVKAPWENHEISHRLSWPFIVVSPCFRGASMGALVRLAWGSGRALTGFHESVRGGSPGLRKGFN